MRPFLQDADMTLWHGDVLDVLRQLPAESVHMACTSPPFYGLRDYQTPGQIGLEENPDLWVARLVEVFREVRRVLRSDGTLWVEIGDSYAGGRNGDTKTGFNSRYFGKPEWSAGKQGGHAERSSVRVDKPNRNVLLHQAEGAHGQPPKHKDLIGAPWLLAFALRADGWYLRSEIIWSKPNPMPESVTDRPTASHSRVFMFAKNPRYYWDAEAIREPHHPDGRTVTRHGGPGEFSVQNRSNGDRWPGAGRNRRSVWEIPTQPYPEAHFATWPEKLVEPMILAGTSERGVCPECGAPWRRVTAVWSGRPQGMTHGRAEKNVTTTGWQPTCKCELMPNRPAEVLGDPVPATVLDPFVGSGTTCFVARRLGRKSIGVDLNREYLELAAKRTQQQSLEFS